MNDINIYDDAQWGGVKDDAEKAMERQKCKRDTNEAGSKRNGVERKCQTR